jgi:epimerase transport system membrane fusion protein
MDIYWSKPPKTFTLIKIIFGLLTGLVVIACLLLFILRVNETIPFQNGEIMARNAPINYRATYEATVSEIRVKEGDMVAKGDTLLVLENEELLSQYRAAQEAYVLAQANIELYKRQVTNLSLMNTTLKEQEQIVNSRYSHNSSDRNIELSALKQQIKGLRENTTILGERLEKEKELVAGGAVSEMEYQEQHQHYLEKLNELTDLQKQYDLRRNAENTLSNTHSSELKQVQLNTLTNEYELINLRKQILEEEKKKQGFLGQMEFMLKELNRLVVISDIDGYVSQLFNTRQAANFVTKETSLITIRPKEEEAFYAKLLLPQASIAKIDTGQLVHFKLAAYNYYQYGILNGKITHISQQDSSAYFYILADVAADHPTIEVKSGFQVKGDIILRELPLFRFILNRLFHSLES